MDYLKLRHVLLSDSEQHSPAIQRRLVPCFLQMADCCCSQALVTVRPSPCVFFKNPFGKILPASSSNVQILRSKSSVSVNTTAPAGRYHIIMPLLHISGLSGVIKSILSDNTIQLVTVHFPYYTAWFKKMDSVS